MSDTPVRGVKIGETGRNVVNYKRSLTLLLTCAFLALNFCMVGLRTSAQTKKTDNIKALNADLLAGCRKGDLSQVKTLLAKGADVNARDATQDTPLMIASLNGYLEVLKLLVTKGADVNASNATGFTALHLAAGLGSNA